MASKPIPVGFAAELTGKQSEASIQMRNGARMAVEEINQAGGVGGRKIELLIEDDGGVPEGAAQADQRLIQQQVVAIVGHLTSNQTLAGYAVTETSQTVLFSPTAATSALTGKKDHFFRLFPTTDRLGTEFARYIYQERKLVRVAIIYDLDNNSYTEPFAGAFEKKLAALGGTVPIQVQYQSSKSPDIREFVEQMRATEADGVFMISSSTFAPLIAQEIRLQNWDVALFAAPWAQGDALIQFGGMAVEGMELILPYDINDPSPKLMAFKERYRARYNEPPTFSAMFGYETLQVLAAGLAKTSGRAQGLSEALAAIGSYPGLSGPVRLDEFGDVIRPLYIIAIQDNQFITKLHLQPEDVWP